MEFVCLPTKHLEALTETRFQLSVLRSVSPNWHHLKSVGISLIEELRDTRVTAGEKPHIERSRTSNNWPREPLKLYA